MEHKTKPNKVVFFKAISSVHMGAGQGLEHIDLPIQREIHTKFPIFYASGIKGAFRQYALEKVWNDLKEDFRNKISLSDLDKWVEEFHGISGEDLKQEIEKKLSSGNGASYTQDDINTIYENIKILAEIFGSQDRRGNLSITDAKILFFPVKSLKGVFAYVTCPLVLERYKDDLSLNFGSILKPEEGKIYASSELVLEGNKVILEEFEFENKETPNGILEKLNLPEELKKQISPQVAIVDNDTFSYFVQNFTEVVNRIKVDPETGTVKQGGLWTEEYLPAESILYSLWFEKRNLTDGEVKYLPSDGGLLNIGGDQTVGKGFVQLYCRRL
jgi:CRISPR-associated protein Cmr4